MFKLYLYIIFMVSPMTFAADTINKFISIGSIHANTINIVVSRKQNIVEEERHIDLSSLENLRYVAKKSKFYSEKDEGKLKFIGNDYFILGGIITSKNSGMIIKHRNNSFLLEGGKTGIVIGVNSNSKLVNIFWKTQKYCIQNEGKSYLCSDEEKIIPSYISDIYPNKIKRVEL